MLRFRSVVARTIALHLVAIAVTSVLMPLALFLMLKHAAEGLHDRALREQAQEILHYVSIRADGTFHLRLPGPLEDLYSEAYGRYAFAILDEEGRVLASSLSEGRPVDAAAPRRQEVIYFHHPGGTAEFYGVSYPAEQSGRKLWVQVSQDLAHRDVLIDDIVAGFFTSVGWITAPILLVLLVIDVLIFRRALRPIVAASTLAGRIGPARTYVRLPEAEMPQEVEPLVHAVNQALDRLDEGFRAQREFTADAAHELRTPLAILRTRIDMIADKELAQSLRDDVASMSRLVNQLLEMAELETFVIRSGETADLVGTATDVAAYLAPLALAQDKSVAVTADADAVHVAGNADMLGRAIRNLVENALVHTAPRTAVDIEVEATGTVRINDRGPGVRAAEREMIFRRFWRRNRNRVGSAGLGLSIVARIAEMHGATVTVRDRSGGGAVFSLIFSEVVAVQRAADQQLAAAQ